MKMADTPSTTDILIALARLETKVDGFTNSHLDHEKRIRILEADHLKLEGRLNKALPVGGILGGAGLGGLITAVWQAFGL